MQNTLQWKHLLDLDVIILEMLLLFSIFSYLVSIRMPVQSQFRASELLKLFRFHRPEGNVNRAKPEEVPEQIKSRAETVRKAPAGPAAHLALQRALGPDEVVEDVFGHVSVDG